MTHCDFSVRSAHIIGSSEPDVISWVRQRSEQVDAERRTKDHMEFLCELYEAETARGRYFCA